MEGKYQVTSDFTSLQDLKKYIRLVNEAGGSVSISRERPEYILSEDPVRISNKIAEKTFIPEIKASASFTNDLERGRSVLHCEIDDEADKSAAYKLLKSVTNFTGVRPTCEGRSL